MKVLILHQHYKTPQSGGAIRSYYLAKALVDQGIRPIVITGHNDVYQVDNTEGIEVHYLPISYDNRFGFLARGTAFIKYIVAATRLAENFKDADFCYAISVPLTVGIVAMRIKRKFNIPFIFEVGDLWPDAPVQMGFVKNYFFRQFLYSLEKQIYHSAQSIVALSPPIKSAIDAKVPGKKIQVIPNMADTDFYKPEEKDPALERKFKVQGKFVISYVGALGVANGLDYFIECVNKSRKAELPIHFLLCGDGALRDRLKRNADHLGLHNLSFVDFVDRDGVKEVLNVTDACFICYKNVPILETGSPNKFFDGLAAGKLIIVNFGGWIRKEIEEAQCGIYVDPRNPDDFVTKIRSFLSEDKRLRHFQQAARELGERKYSRKLLSKEFTDLFRHETID
ncbi:MAG TPA: glycosyltransferase family 4 protein [Cyclobacteriaceae bacterium]|nr:glycosyltransferase family 4 protein [Cyclobacteriaceae bacterium]